MCDRHSELSSTINWLQSAMRPTRGSQFSHDPALRTDEAKLLVASQMAENYLKF